MRMLFLVLVARSGAGVAGSELLQRREWPRGVVLGLARERGHGAALAAAHVGPAVAPATHAAEEPSVGKVSIPATFTLSEQGTPQGALPLLARAVA